MLPRCPAAVTSDFVGSLRDAKKLGVLDLSSSPGVTGQALQELATGCRMLTRLELARCSNITDAGLQAVAGMNPGLSHLAVSGSRHLTDDGVAKAIRVLRRLRNFDCAGCPQLLLRTPAALS